MDKKELRIALIGKTGSGKSSTGNTILGKDVFKFDSSFSSITKSCEQNEAIIDKQKTVVVDTPGFFDPNVKQEDTIREISRCVSMTTPGLHAFLFVVAIGRFTEEDIKTVDVFNRQYGQGVENYMIVIFTRADELQKPIEDYLSEAPEYLIAFLKSIGRRYIAFDNKSKYKRERQVQDLIKLINNTVRENGGKCYTNEMYDANMKMLAKREKELKEKKTDEREKRKEQFGVCLSYDMPGYGRLNLNLFSQK